MELHTGPGDLCYEPFSGSGSQMVAAERTRRRCYAIEKSPPFVADRQLVVDDPQRALNHPQLHPEPAREG